MMSCEPIVISIKMPIKVFKGHAAYTIYLYEMPRKGKFIEILRSVDLGLERGGRKGPDYRRDENSLQLDSGNGCTALRNHLTSTLTRTLYKGEFCYMNYISVTLDNLSPG